MIISFSGIDGSGKSSTISLLKKDFHKCKVIFLNQYFFLDFFLSCLKVFFQTKKKINKKKSIFLLKKNNFFLFKFWPLFVVFDNFLLYAYAKFYSIRGFVVFCDRYFVDKLVSYNLHGYSNKICNKIYMSLYIKSDLHFFLKTNIKVAKSREIGNSHSEKFFLEISNLYQRFHNEINQNCYVISTNNNQAKVKKKILNIIKKNREK